jgi:hypothetical protein
MHQQLWGYKVEWKSVSRGTGGKKVEHHCSRVYHKDPVCCEMSHSALEFTISKLLCT